MSKKLQPPPGDKWHDPENVGAPDRQSNEIEERVIAKIRQRRDTGRAKYGTTMERKDLSFIEWVQHLQEELMDAAIYAEKIIRDHSEMK